MTYTVEDFKNARFADHTDGGLALRCDMGLGDYFWVDFEGIEYTDEEMLSSGWSPVIEPQLTQSEFKDIAGRLFYKREDINNFVMRLHYVLKEIGVPIVEDLKKELPTEPGSVILTEDNTRYVLGKDEHWWYGNRSVGPAWFNHVDWEVVA